MGEIVRPDGGARPTVFSGGPVVTMDARTAGRDRGRGPRRPHRCGGRGRVGGGASRRGSRRPRGRDVGARLHRCPQPPLGRGPAPVLRRRDRGADRRRSARRVAGARGREPRSSISCACTVGTRTVGASRSTATCSTRPSATGRWCWRTTRCISVSRTRSRSIASASGPRRRIRRPVRSDAVPTGFRTACSSSARGARRTRGRSPRTPMPIVGRSTSRPGRGTCGGRASPPCTTPRARPRPKACTRRWRPRERCRCRCSRSRIRRRCCATSPTAASTARRPGRGASGSGSDR